MVRAPAYTQPIPTDPLASACDDRLTSCQRSASLQRIRKRFCRKHRAQRSHYGGRSADLRRQRLAISGRTFVASLHQRHATFRQVPQGTRKCIKAVNANGFEIVTQSGFDRPFPPRLDFKRLCNARTLREPRTGKPLCGTASIMGQRSFLQRLERRLLCASTFTLRTRRLQSLFRRQLFGAE